MNDMQRSEQIYREPDAPQRELPEPFRAWFSSRGWQPRAHQMAVMRQVQAGNSVLLIAPTGGGKTLAGFLAPIVEMAGSPRQGLKTLYISPLKALAVDIVRNLQIPLDEMGLEIDVETRTGDTPQAKRRRQLSVPPDILVTTPEQVSLLLSHRGAEHFFGDLRWIIVDELHALATSKRGVLLSLALARLRSFRPGLVTIGLSATVRDAAPFRAWLMPQPDAGVEHMASLVTATGGAEPHIDILASDERLPWSGHSARYAITDIYKRIRDNRMTLVFVNTRSQAEVIFQELWHANDDGLAIALHHGSLDAGQRRKVEAAMAKGDLRAVVCTSTLDLGIDWGDVDLVINVGAPKGSSRILQRIGRANHRLEEPSNALLVPANRFEVLECEAARQAVRQGSQDAAEPMELKRDVLAQHILCVASAGPFQPDQLFAETTTAWPYRMLPRDDFDDAIDFVSTGGYALRRYDQYAKLRPLPDGSLRLAHPRIAQHYRMNAGTIVEAEMLTVRLVRSNRAGRRAILRGGRILGEIEQWFIDQLTPGDTFMFAGQILRFEGLEELTALASRTTANEAKVPSWEGGKFPLSTYLAERVRGMLADPARWSGLPRQVRDWLSIQRYKSVLPGADQMLVETFPRALRHYLVCYPFEGRLAHQTLGMLLTRRLERNGARPMGFVANDYALGVWCLDDLSLRISRGKLKLGQLFDEDMLGDDLDAWLAESSLMKRTFRTCAIISGLIEKNWPGKEKTGRQITVSSDLIFDVLRTHQPDHWLLKAAWDDAASGLIDAHRLGRLLARIKGRVIHRALETVSPLAVPVMLEIGREPIYGQGDDSLLHEAANQLLSEAMRLV